MTDISSYDRWHISWADTCRVIVIHDGPDALGHTYVDGHHEHLIERFETPELALEAVERHNRTP